MNELEELKRALLAVCVIMNIPPEALIAVLSDKTKIANYDYEIGRINQKINDAKRQADIKAISQEVIKELKADHEVSKIINEILEGPNGNKRIE